MSTQNSELPNCSMYDLICKRKFMWDKVIPIFQLWSQQIFQFSDQVKGKKTPSFSFPVSQSLTHTIHGHQLLNVPQYLINLSWQKLKSYQDIWNICVFFYRYYHIHSVLNFSMFVNHKIKIICHFYSALCFHGYVQIWPDVQKSQVWEPSKRHSYYVIC